MGCARIGRACPARWPRWVRNTSWWSPTGRSIRRCAVISCSGRGAISMGLAPAFLFGLLAIGLPLWLHRFARQTQERRQFASLMLIEAGEVRRSRRQQLRYLVLLALRI